MQKKTRNPGDRRCCSRQCCSGPEGSYDYDKTANFAAFKTYAQKDGTQGRTAADRRPHRRRHRHGDGGEGIHQAERNPDVFVVYHVAFDKQKDISTYSSGYGGGYGAYGWG